jgi:acetyltransferase-like isoleucine patch superfamily enzyme
VRIEEGVLLGSNCVIKEKKTVGRNAKIGMGAVVFFDVDPDAVVMSAPPKIVRPDA